jgi:hypothetical protein
MNTGPFRSKLATVGAALAALILATAPARAQRFHELGVGWNAVASAPTSSSDRFRSGPYFRGSIGRSLTPRTSLRLDVNAMLFRLQTLRTVPCPFPACPNPLYDNHIRGVAGLGATGLLGLNSRGLVYLIGGVGAYDAETQVNSMHVGASAGGGIAIPVGPRYRAVIEATWHGLVPRRNGPSWLAPFSVGFRF